jgi:Kef-type K+ transport system membrane component KefB
MKKIALFSSLLVVGLVGAQLLPSLAGDLHAPLLELIGFLTMVGLAFIMIHVGYEFEIDKGRLRGYAWDYVVAMGTAGLPWVFATLYFLLILLPSDAWGSWQAWKETLLMGRFAAPTATGVLFSMLAAAGLSATWMFRKTRILVIFDDLDTVLLMIPLKVFMVGLAWQLGAVVIVMFVMLWVAWRWLHRLTIPTSWPCVLTYAVLIAGASEAIYWGTKVIDYRVPIHLEVLLPAFVLGCVMRRPAGSDPHCDDGRVGHQEGPESAVEQRVSTLVSGIFMVLVGLTMPPLVGAAVEEAPVAAGTVSGAQPPLGAGMLAVHVLALTVLINIGKMVPAFCYRREAHWKERFAVALGMCPRGEVGAGVILLSLDYGITGPMVNVAVFSLALNLLLTPLFIYAVTALLRRTEAQRRASVSPK